MEGTSMCMAGKNSFTAKVVVFFRIMHCKVYWLSFCLKFLSISSQLTVFVQAADCEWHIHSKFFTHLDDLLGLPGFCNRIEQ